MPIASNDRIGRVNEILKREIADLIEQSGLNDGGVLISVTKVDTTVTLKDAIVFISVLGGGEEAKEKALRELARHRAELQRRIARDIVLKYTPVLHFHLDRNLEDGDKVLALIRELEKKDDPSN